MSLCLCGESSAAEGEPVAEKLDNGLRVVVVEDHDVPLVSVQLWFAAGAGVDHPEEAGIAVVARCALANRDEGDLRLRAAGALCLSRTLFDATSFEATLRPELLDLALDVQRVRLESRPFSERDVARAESMSRAAPAAALMSDYGGAMWLAAPVDACQADDPVAAALRAALYPGQPCGHAADFVAADVAGRLRAADLDQFAARWFVPGGATLFVIGDVAPADVLERVKRRFAALPWKEPPRRPEYASADSVLVRNRIETSAAEGLDFAWSVTPWGYAENAGLDVATRVLCDPLDGPLTRRLGEIGLPAPRVRREAWRDDGMLVLSIDAPRPQREKVESRVSDALRELAERGPSPVALNRARRQVGLAVADARCGFADRAARLAAQEVIGGDMMLDRFEPSSVMRVSHGAVKRAAGQLADRRRVILTRVPWTAATRPSTAAVAEHGVERLDASEALAALDQAADKTLPAPPAVLVPPPTSLEVNGVTVRLYTFVGPARLAVVATAPIQDADEQFPCSRLLEEANASADGRLADLMSYHGMTLHARRGLDATDARRAAVVVEIACDRAQLPTAVELLGEIARARRAAPSWPDFRNVQLDFVGDVTQEDVAAAVRDYWPVVSPPTQPVSRPAASAGVLPASLRVVWRPGDADRVEAAFVIPLAAIPRASGPDFYAQRAAWLLGAPGAAFADVDGARAWRWTCEISSGRLTASAHLTAAKAMACLKRMVPRITQLTEGRIPENELRQAARLAATSTVLSLNDLRAVRAWMPGRAAFAAPHLASAGGPPRMAITLAVVGGPAALAHELEAEFGTVEHAAESGD